MVSNSDDNAEGCIVGKTNTPCRTGGGKKIKKKVRVSGLGVWLLFGGTQGRRTKAKPHNPKPEPFSHFFCGPLILHSGKDRVVGNPV